MVSDSDNWVRSRPLHRSLIERAASRLDLHRADPDRGAPAVTEHSQGGGGHPANASSRPTRSKTVVVDVQTLHDNNIITPAHLSSKMTEEFRILKRPLLATFVRDKSVKSNLILVTSAVAKEGKTFTSLNLAMSIAVEQDVRVLFVDCDLFKAQAVQLLGISPDKGFIDVLTHDETDLADVMVRTDIDGLSVVPPGRCHELAPELLASKKMAQLMQEMAQRYADRLIIFDSPPVLLRTETAALARHVGQVVFVVRAESTAREAVKEALDLLGDVPNLGLVLNNTRSSLGSSHFGAYYDRHYPAYRAGGTRGGEQAKPAGA